MGDFCFSIDEERYDDRHGHVLSLDGWYSHPDRKIYGFELLGDGYDTVELPEIQRLNQKIQQMENTKVWKLYRIIKKS